MREAMRGYLHAASGLTELTRKRAQELALSLLSSSGAAGAAGGGAAVAHQVSSLAEELVCAAKSNRAAMLRDGQGRGRDRGRAPRAGPSDRAGAGPRADRSVGAGGGRAAPP